MTGIGVLVVKGDVEAAIERGKRSYLERFQVEATAVRVGKDIKVEGNQLCGLTVVDTHFQPQHVCVGRRE